MVREILSSSLDGEASDEQLTEANEHITGCIECSAWQGSAFALHGAVRIAPAEEVPDLTTAIMTAAGPAVPSARADALRACRWVLAACALLQLVTAISSLLGDGGGPIHMDHELGSWDIGLAFGFLIAAVQPKRAWGMLPLLFVVAAALGVTAVTDMIDGTVSATREAAHITELMGFVFTFLVARLNTNSTHSLKFALS